MIALTRPVPRFLMDCQLTHLQRVTIDITAARAQHAEYERTLAALGCEIVQVPAADALPDSVFVEDTAIVLDEIAIITLDGGDVLRLGRVLYVGLGTRTNSAGVQQLADVVAPYGYDVRTVRMDDCLHLKSAVTEVGSRIVVINPEWITGQMFPDHAIIEVDPSEPAAANVLRIGDTVICPAAHPRTNARLSSAAPR